MSLLPSTPRRHAMDRSAMLRRLLLVAIAVFGMGPGLEIGLGMDAHAADLVYPSGSRIGLQLMEGLAEAKGFPGFENAEKGVKLLLTELPPAAFDAFEQATKDQAKAKSGPAAKANKAESFSLALGKAYLSHEDGSAAGVPAKRWALIARAEPGKTGAGSAESGSSAPAAKPEATTVYILMEIPTAAASAYPDDAVRRMLATVSMRAEVPVAEQIEQMPFRVNETANFKLVRTLIPRSALLLTDGTEHSHPEEAPYLVISTGTGGPTQAEDRNRFASNLLNGIPGLKESRIVSSEPIRLGGLPGIETRVEGVGAVNNTPMTVVQWVRFGPGGFLRIVGGASKDEWAKAFPRFRAVRDGIEPR